MPVRMRRAPRTPKAGSILVSRVIGFAVVDALAEADAVLVTLADVVGVATTVTLKIVGMAVVTATVWVPDRLKDVETTVLVVNETVVLPLGEVDDVTLAVD